MRASYGRGIAARGAFGVPGGAAGRWMPKYEAARARVTRAPRGAAGFGD
ncbi:MAG: hypothetical protein AVDCRST_MAG68-625 [uncultured Gemmatimonadetes bacterium]|uniref:Uncharacterized protein n=1 Tax=uncultured Gemmatimonadota bacterium TaxID=203437 RepID=A0A6J4KF22_9BACT|nr:MAG: hypothetical protein AVDCRST_MAG68-625 [uncultured Gemmatimonadota bacterium]